MLKLAEVTGRKKREVGSGENRRHREKEGREEIRTWEEMEDTVSRGRRKETEVMGTCGTRRHKCWEPCGHGRNWETGD